jgi:hypothetical protein
MATTTCFILGDPVDGPAYRELLQFMLSAAVSFSLTVHGRPSSSMLDALRDLKPFAIDVREVNEWPGTQLLPGFTATLYTYSTTRESIAQLARLARGLYDWQNLELPDDLCFYRADGTVILTSVAHEDHADIVLTESEERAFRAFTLIPYRRLLVN